MEIMPDSRPMFLSSKACLKAAPELDLKYWNCKTTRTGKLKYHTPKIPTTFTAVTFAAYGNLTMLKHLYVEKDLGHYINVSIANDQVNTLDYALSMAREEVSHLLVYRAISGKSPKCALYLIEKGCYEYDSYDCLNEACFKGLISIVLLILKKNPHVDISSAIFHCCRGSEGTSAKTSSSSSYLELVKHFYLLGSLVTEGCLYEATRCGNLPIIKFLLDEAGLGGDDDHNSNTNYNKAVIIACGGSGIGNGSSENESLEIVKFLHSRGADLTDKNFKGFIDACSNGNTEVVKYIFRCCKECIPDEVIYKGSYSAVLKHHTELSNLLDFLKTM
jgi:hypothetical protein